MKSLRFLTGIVVWAWFLSSGAAARAVDISGSPTSTIVIFEDSQLVGDLDCSEVPSGTSCIQFGADHITLRLNGFTMAGVADPNLGCTKSSASTSPKGGENGIFTAGHSDLQILGPGLVRDFRGIGVLVDGGAKVKVSKVTTSGNCICGIGLFPTSSTSGDGNDNDVEDNVVVRIGNTKSPCGGMNISTNNNRVRRNVVGGNGYDAVAWYGTGPGQNTNLNFGINIAGTENVVEENVAVGNANGIVLTPAANGDVVRRNIITGNPTLQDSQTFGAVPAAAAGFDIVNLSPNANTFDDNLCLTSNVSGLCPNIPKFPRTEGGDEGDHIESR